MIIISHPTRSIVVRFDPAIRQLFPQGSKFSWRGADFIKLPHGIDETRMLRNLNFPVPSPIEEHYAFPSADGKKAFGKQVATAASMTMNPRSYVLNTMGTGKTKAAIWAHDFLKLTGRVDKMLVVAPLSTLVFTWEREFLMTLPERKVIVLTGTAERRKKLLAQDADVYIINHDGVRVVLNELLARHDIDCICFDEAAAYRNARAERSKIARKLAHGRKYVWGMTGSPTPSDPTDAFGLAHLITPGNAPRSFVQFRQDTMTNISQWKWVPKRDASDTVAKILQPAVRYTLDEIVELPPVIERDIEVKLGKRQEEGYRRLKNDAAAMFKEGTVTAVNGGVLFTKLLQVSLGWLYDDNGKVIELDNDDRLDALMDIVEGRVDSTRPDAKVIVFSPFKSSMRGISKRLACDKIDYAEVSGDTSSADRAAIFTAFQGTDKYKVLCAHPDCMSHGLTLTAADTIVWYGPTTKLETYSQANARITRVGQTRKQQIIRLLSTPAERMLYRRLAAKATLQDSILDILATLTTGD
jgi:SNF2 family DNA or RNA helicase